MDNVRTFDKPNTSNAKPRRRSAPYDHTGQGPRMVRRVIRRGDLTTTKRRNTGRTKDPTYHHFQHHAFEETNLLHFPFLSFLLSPFTTRI